MVGILFILMAWFIQMPLWLSIVATVIGSLRIIESIIKLLT